MLFWFYWTRSIIDDFSSVFLNELDAGKQTFLGLVECYQLIVEKIDALVVPVHVLELMPVDLWPDSLKVGVRFSHIFIPVAKVIIKEFLILVVKLDVKRWRNNFPRFGSRPGFKHIHWLHKESSPNEHKQVCLMMLAEFLLQFFF